MQKDAMDVLQAWVDQYNARAGASIALDSGGEAGGALERRTRRRLSGAVSARPVLLRGVYSAGGRRGRRGRPPAGDPRGGGLCDPVRVDRRARRGPLLIRLSARDLSMCDVRIETRLAR